MKYVFISVLIFFSYGFTIGFGEGSTKNIEYADEYLNEVIYQTYRNLGIKLEVKKFPLKRLNLLEKNGKLDAISVDYDRPAIRKNYLKVPIPIAVALRVFLATTASDNEKLVFAIIRGNDLEEELVKSFKKKVVKVYRVNDYQAALKMFHEKRVNAIFIDKVTSLYPIPESEHEKIWKSAKKIKEVKFFHFVHKKNAAIFNQVKKEIQRLHKLEQFQYKHFRKKKRAEKIATPPPLP